MRELNFSERLSVAGAIATVSGQGNQMEVILSSKSDFFVLSGFASQALGLSGNGVLFHHGHTGFFDRIFNYPDYYVVKPGDLTDISVTRVADSSAAAHYILTRN